MFTLYCIYIALFGVLSYGFNLTAVVICFMFSCLMMGAESVKCIRMYVCMYVYVCMHTRMYVCMYVCKDYERSGFAWYVV